MKRWIPMLLLAALALLCAVPAPADLTSLAGQDWLGSVSLAGAPPLLGTAPFAAGMIVNQANLSNLFAGFKAAFQNGFTGVQPMWPKIATLVPSGTSEEHYAWLGDFPSMREWLGDRHVKSLAAYDYTVRNKDFEVTIGVKRPHLEDDQYGVYAPRFGDIGQAAARHPDQLIWALLAAGFATSCYDGQNFFDTDHPVKGGVSSNTQAGAQTPWFLFDVSRMLKPLIYQKRKDYQLVAMTRPEDERVFTANEFRYGVDGRCNVGFGFWQMALGSKATLDKANYALARAAMMSFKSDEGTPLGIMPRLLVVPPSLEGAALEILNAERDAAGATNVWKGTAELAVIPYLA